MIPPRHMARIRRVLPATRSFVCWSSRHRTRGARYYEVVDARTGERLTSVVWADARQGVAYVLLRDERGMAYREPGGKTIAGKAVLGDFVIRLREGA